jgi:hypothetical protein
MCQKIFYYFKDYYKNYSEELNFKKSYHIADIIESNLNKLEKENKLIYMNIKEIFKFIHDIIDKEK